MIGRVDEEGRALVTIRMGAAKNALVHEVDVWVDTWKATGKQHYCVERHTEFKFPVHGHVTKRLS